MVVGIYVVVRHSRMAQSMFSVYSSGAQYFGSDLFVFFSKIRQHMVQEYWSALNYQSSIIILITIV